MPIDTSMYAAAVPKPYNPLDTVKTVTGINNAMQSNKLLQQQTTNAALENQRGQVGLSQEKAKLALQHYENAQRFFGSMANDPDLTPQKVQDAAAWAVSKGLFTADEVAQEGKNLPSDPALLPQWAKAHQFKALDGMQQIQQQYGTTVENDNGLGKIVSTQDSPFMGGQRHEQNFIRNQLDPAQKAAQQTIIEKDEHGNPVQKSVPLSDLVNNYGLPGRGSNQPQGPLVQDISGGQNPLAPQQTSQNPPPLGSPDQYTRDSNALNPQNEYESATVLNPDLLNAGAQTANQDTDTQDTGRPSPMQPLGMPGAVQTGFAPGDPEALAIDKKAAAEQGVALQQAADNASRKGVLNEMDALIKSGGFTTGPGTELVKNFKAGAAAAFGLKSDEIASFDTFNKLGTQLAQQQFATLGGTGTDAKLDSAMHTSPSTALSNQSNAEILALLKGNEDAISIKNQEWQKYKEQHGPGSYNKFATEFNKEFDPRYFQIPYLDAKSVEKIKKNMSKKEYKEFYKGFEKAEDKGWVK